jgi:hypothetical protein
MCVCVCVFYVNIKICIYYIVLKKLNVLQINLYNINIYFGLGLGRFWVRFDNIYIIFIIYQVR